VHAAGVLVSSIPLQGAVPMRRSPRTGVIATQFDMWEIEELGGVKLDLLGIRHLDTLSHARRLIHERHGVWIDYDRSGLSVPAGCTSVLKFGLKQFRDPDIWAQIDAGQTTGIFQVETPNCTESAIVFKPRSEKDVADLTSIIRPGVADAGLKDVYLYRRNGRERVVYDHPMMERFVGPSWVTDTYGILVYQEQLMDCVGTLAGFDADEADGVRGAVGKKLMDKLMPFKERFIQGCLSSSEFMRHWESSSIEKAAEQGLRVINHIWDSIEASGRYAFNWSHAVGYAMIATWEIWTKYYYPQEFLVALMATDSENINRYLREARRRKIPILPPDINKSDTKFTIEGDAIRYGIDTIRGVGLVAARDIQQGRPYSSFEDYLDRAERGAEKTAAFNLVLIGAFDEMGERTEMLGRLERYRILQDVSAPKLARLTEAEKDEIWADKRERLSHKYALDRPDFDDLKVVYQIEKELVGSYVTVDPLARYLATLDACSIRDPRDVNKFKVKEEFIIGGLLTAIRPTTTKKGRNPGQAMAHITVAWNEEEFRIVVFPEAWARTKVLLEVDTPVACKVQRLNDGCCLQTVERLDRLFDIAGIA
jgi:DNA polymerase-3 subunit alpha